MGRYLIEIELEPNKKLEFKGTQAFEFLNLGEL